MKTVRQRRLGWALPIGVVAVLLLALEFIRRIDTGLALLVGAVVLIVATVLFLRPLGK